MLHKSKMHPQLDKNLEKKNLSQTYLRNKKYLNELLPSLLVFRAMPYFSAPSRAQSTREEWFWASRQAREEMETAVA